MDSLNHYIIQAVVQENSSFFDENFASSFWGIRKREFTQNPLSRRGFSSAGVALRGLHIHLKKKDTSCENAGEMSVWHDQGDESVL
jgi:hypothetical protein